MKSSKSTRASATTEGPEWCGCSELIARQTIFQFIVGTKHVHKLHKKSSFNKHSWAQSRQFKTHVRRIIHWVNALVEKKNISIYIGEKLKKKKKEKHVWCLSHLNCGQKFTIVPQLSTQPGFMILINGNIASSNIFFLIFYVMAYLDVHPVDFFGHFFIIFVFLNFFTCFHILFCFIQQKLDILVIHTLFYFFFHKNILTSSLSLFLILVIMSSINFKIIWHTGRISTICRHIYMWLN